MGIDKKEGSGGRKLWDKPQMPRGRQGGNRYQRGGVRGEAILFWKDNQMQTKPKSLVAFHLLRQKAYVSGESLYGEAVGAFRE